MAKAYPLFPQHLNCQLERGRRTQCGSGAEAPQVCVWAVCKYLAFNFRKIFHYIASPKPVWWNEHGLNWKIHCGNEPANGEWSIERGQRARTYWHCACVCRDAAKWVFLVVRWNTSTYLPSRLHGAEMNGIRRKSNSGRPTRETTTVVGCTTPPRHPRENDCEAFKRKN